MVAQLLLPFRMLLLNVEAGLLSTSIPVPLPLTVLLLIAEEGMLLIWMPPPLPSTVQPVMVEGGPFSTTAPQLAQLEIVLVAI